MNNKLFHLGFFPDDINAKYAILTGDPARVPKIAKKIGNATKIANNREFLTYSAKIGNVSIVVCSTGIGGPSAAIAVEELQIAGVKNFIRVGTCGGMQINVKSGDLIIATAATRNEGTTMQYAPISFPAVADFNIVGALKTAAEQNNYNYHVGVVHSKDSFYSQHSPERMPIAHTLINEWNALISLNVLASEMECAAIFTVCASLGCKCSAVLNCLWNQEREHENIDKASTLNSDVPLYEPMDKATTTAIDAILMLINN